MNIVKTFMIYIECMILLLDYWSYIMNHVFVSYEEA